MICPRCETGEMIYRGRTYECNICQFVLTVEHLMEPHTFAYHINGMVLRCGSKGLNMIGLTDKGVTICTMNYEHCPLKEDERQELVSRQCFKAYDPKEDD